MHSFDGRVSENGFLLDVHQTLQENGLKSPFFFIGTSRVIMVQKLYRIIRERISNSMYSGDLV